MRAQCSLSPRRWNTSHFFPSGTTSAWASPFPALCGTDPGRWLPAHPAEATTAPAAVHCKHGAVLWQAAPQCQVTSPWALGWQEVGGMGGPGNTRWVRPSRAGWWDRDSYWNYRQPWNKFPVPSVCWAPELVYFSQGPQTSCGLFPYFPNNLRRSKRNLNSS